MATTLHLQHLEAWYDVHVWSRLLDDCFFGNARFYLERREGTSAATAERRNRNRAAGARLRLGSRADGILRRVGDPRIEFGLIEAGRGFTSAQGTKWRDDCGKVARGLHDMLVRLNRESGGRARVLRRLQVVGLVCAGTALQVRRLVCPGGHVCVLRTEQRLAVPTGVEGLVDLLRIVLAVLQVREVVEETERALREGGGGDLMEELRGDGEGEQKVDLRWFVDTDPESRGE